MAKYPALPLWTDAYLADTTHLSLEEHGIYLMLLMLAWRSPDCAIPNNKKRILRMLRVHGNYWPKIEQILTEFWHLSDDKWKQQKLNKCRSKVDHFSETQRQRAQKRWNDNTLKNNNTTNATRAGIPNARGNANHNHNQYIPNPTHIPSTTAARENGPNDDGGGGFKKIGEYIPCAFTESFTKHIAELTNSSITDTCNDINQLEQQAHQLLGPDKGDQWINETLHQLANDPNVKNPIAVARHRLKG